MGKSTNQTVNAQAVVFPYTPNVQTTIPGQTNYFNFLAPGLMIMIVMMTVMTGIPEAISKEKEMGTFDGMLSAPINQVSIILGKTAALCVRGFGQCILILVLAMLFFGVTIQGSIILAFFMLLLGIFSFRRNWNCSSFHVRRSGIKNHDSEPFNVPNDVSGRSFLSNTADAMVHAGHLKTYPLTYAADAMRKIMLLNAGLGDVYGPSTHTCGFGIVTMAIAVPLFRKSMTR